MVLCVVPFNKGKYNTFFRTLQVFNKQKKTHTPFGGVSRKQVMKYDNKLHSENLAKFFEVASFAVKTLGGLHTEFEHVAVFGDAVVETRDEAVGNIGRLALDAEVLVVPFSHFEDKLRSVAVETLVAVGKHLALVGTCGNTHGENRVEWHFGVFGAEVEHGLAHLFLAVEDGLLRLELREVVLLGLGGCVGTDHGLDIGLGRYVDDIHGEDDFLFLCGGGFFFHDVYFLNGLTFDYGCKYRVFFCSDKIFNILF